MSAGEHQPKAEPPYTTVVFDCDSTLSTIEGIEDLASGHGDEIRRLTDRAMNGELPLEQVYGARLDVIQPTADQVAALGARYLETLLPNVPELVAALRFLGKRVCIVSGGLLPPVREVGLALGLAAEDIFAVDIHFDQAGRYAGFDQRSPAARAGGKLELLRAIRGTNDAVVLIGDGATDLEAAPACARFVGFGGVIPREAVLNAADVRCVTPDFAALAPLLLSRSELDRLAQSSAHQSFASAVKDLSLTP